VTKLCDLEVARTGLTEKEAEAAGYAFVTASVESRSRAGYYPGAAPMTVKLIAEKRTGLLLGGQIVGRGGGRQADRLAGHRALEPDDGRGDDRLDLSYAPPFSPVWDPVLIAARKATDAVHARWTELPASGAWTFGGAENPDRIKMGWQTGHQYRFRPPSALGPPGFRRRGTAGRPAVDVHLAAVPVHPRRPSHRLGSVRGVHVSIRPRVTPSFISARRSSHSSDQQRSEISGPAWSGASPARNSTSLA
jgi:hypothetical protein